jgi:fatty acid desaturase
VIQKKSANEIDHETKLRTLLNKRVDAHPYYKTNVFKALWVITFQWIVITASFAAAVWSAHPLVYIVAMFIICSRQHALGVIMHDAAHGRLFKNKQTNELLSNIFCAFPLTVTTNRYRYYHLLHHRNLNSDKDPDFTFFNGFKTYQWPKTRLQAAVIFLRDIFGLNALKEREVVQRWMPTANHFSNRTVPPPLGMVDRLSFYLFATVVVAALWYLDAWLYFVILWLVPLNCLLTPFRRMRTLGEHITVPGKSGTEASRHIDGTWLERMFISPCNVNFHIAHHLFPAVPLYNLPALHARLMEEPEYRDFGVHKQSYLSLNKNKGVLGEILHTAA